jgi:hypothetical protein
MFVIRRLLIRFKRAERQLRHLLSAPVVAKQCRSMEIYFPASPLVVEPLQPAVLRVIPLTAIAVHALYRAAVLEGSLVAINKISTIICNVTMSQTPALELLIARRGVAKAQIQFLLDLEYLGSVRIN